MRKVLLSAALAGTFLIAPGLVPQAHAAHGWFATGVGFRVGAAHISFLFGQPFGRYAPAYYYRYDRPIAYRGYHCSRYCYREGAYYYHHESCPLVRAHFRAYSVDPYWAYSRYAPHVDYGYDAYDGGYYGGGYYDDGYYDPGYYGSGGVYIGGIYYRDGYRHRDGRHYRNDRYYRDHRSYRDGHRYDRRYDRRDRYDRHDRYDRRDRNRNDRRHRDRDRGHRRYRH